MSELVFADGKVTVVGGPADARPSFWCEDLEEEKSWDSRVGDRVITTVAGAADPLACVFVAGPDGERGQLRCTFGPYTHRRTHPADPAPWRFEIVAGAVRALTD